MEQTFGKFKGEEELLKGYTNLEKAFTKKCQETSELKRELDALKEKLTESEKDKDIEVFSDIEVAQDGEESATIEGDNERTIESESAIIKEVIKEENAEEVAAGEKVVEFKGEDDGLNFSSSKFKSDVIRFLTKTPDAKLYLSEIGKILLENRALLTTASPVETAYFIAKGKMAKENSEKIDLNAKTFSVKESTDAKVYPKLISGRSEGFGTRERKKYGSFEDARADLLKYFS